MTDKKTVAWKITEPCEGYSTIVFHHHGLAARRIGANEVHWACEFEGVECDRTPQFDQYAEQGYVPPKVLLANGWWLPCHACHATISEYVDNPDDVVEEGSNAFCNTDCQQMHHDTVNHINTQHNHYRQLILAKYPYHPFTNWQQGYPLYTLSAEFDFPGRVHGLGRVCVMDVRQDNAEIELTVLKADADAYRLWKAAGYPSGVLE